MSIQDVKIKAMQAVMGATVPVISHVMKDNTFRIDGSHVIYSTREEAEGVAEKDQLLNILVSIAEGFELDWGTDNKKIEIRFKG